MPEKAAVIDYLKWNEIIAKHFFKEEKAGKEVLLYINEPLIKSLGEPYGESLNEFIHAVKHGPDWVRPSDFCQLALQAYDNWRSRNVDYPPYIGYLAFFVLAAGVEGDFDAKAYYPRFWKLLNNEDSSGTPRSFEQMIDLWDDLEKWSREDKNETLGKFEARIRGNWWKVGLPLSQLLISEEERRHLPILFDKANLDPVDTPPPDVMARLLKEFGADILEKRTYRLLESKKKEDVALRGALMNLVLEELENWDGAVLTQEQTEQKRQMHTNLLRLCLSRDSLANTVAFYVRFKTNKSFPEGGLSFTGDRGTHTWSCSESYQGWSKMLKDYQTRPHLKLDGTSLDWLSGMEFKDAQNSWRAVLRGATTKLFIPGKFEVLPDWIEKQRLDRNMEFLIASYGDDIRRLREWGLAGCKDFKELSVGGLPEGWIMFSGKNAFKICPGIDVLSISPVIRLLIRGGIKTGIGNAYFRFAPPRIVLENGLGEEKVNLNDNELTREDPQTQVWQLPEDAPVAEPLRIEVSVNGQVLKRIVWLEEPEPPLIAKYDARRDACGVMCQQDSSLQQACGVIVHSPDGHDFPPMPRSFSFLLSNKITFVGASPGQIAEWPHEEVPQNWMPVWALSKLKRGIFVANFCAYEQPVDQCAPGTSLSDKRLVKRWKKALWYDREKIIPPDFRKVKDMWEKYVSVAKNV